MSENICPNCGGQLVHGMCLSCGSVPKHEAVEKPRSAVYENNAKPLTDVAAPTLFTLTGEEAAIAPSPREAAAKSFVNPYAGLIPFEKPDFGDNYAVPQAVIRENGTPRAVRFADDEELSAKKVRISSGRRISDYWWIIMLSLLLPWQVSWLPAPALFKFDEKGGRQSAAVILAVTAVKMLVGRFWL